MAVYVVTGVMGSGKTLAMVGRMRDYIAAGKPVATNIDLNIPKLTSKSVRAPVWRLPDRPKACDLEALGAAHETGREELNGGLFLDEAGAWLNARSWNDKDRQAFIDWMLHARKRGWDVFIVVQSIVMLDKQIREGLGEYQVLCRRMDRVTIPFIGKLIRILSLGLISGKLPKIHVANVYYGLGQGAIKADTWHYLGRDLYGAYSTQQVMGHAADGVRLVADEACGPPRPARIGLKPKLRRIELLMKLPERERLRVAAHWARIGLLGQTGPAVA